MKTCYQKICLVCSSRSTTTYYNLYELWFLHNKNVKFYATTVSLTNFIFYINKGNAGMKILQYIRLQINRSSYQRCSVKKKRVLRNFAKSFIKKEALAQVFSCEFCKISKNTFSTEHIRTTASGLKYYNSDFI